MIFSSKTVDFGRCEWNNRSKTVIEIWNPNSTDEHSAARYLIEFGIVNVSKESKTIRNVVQMIDDRLKIFYFDHSWTKAVRIFKINIHIY